jgi:hypothetical protein
LLVSWCAGGRCDMAGNDEDHGRSRRLVQRIVMVAQIGYSVAGQLRGWVTPCVICTMHVEMRSAGFLVEPQNQGRWFVSDLA